IPTEKSWGVIFPEIDSNVRHPSQIYEALLEGFVLFLILNIIIFNKKSYFGLVSSIFLILYGTFRLACEQFREPDEHIGYIFNYFSMGSILSIVMIFFGFLFMFKIIFDEKNR
ncbi:MAG: prolipoprotein diacylglyceryl transferase, partial [Pelagibacteraceae bacterium]|nr:prolipoprotein diacylglyceryl transferase [Pelagibacteraceae bacterium]